MQIKDTRNHQLISGYINNQLLRLQISLLLVSIVDIAFVLYLMTGLCLSYCHVYLLTCSFVVDFNSKCGCLFLSLIIMFAQNAGDQGFIEVLFKRKVGWADWADWDHGQGHWSGEIECWGNQSYTNRRESR